MLGFAKVYSIVLVCLLLLIGCGTMQVNTSNRPFSLSSQDTIAVLPFNNMTETPEADERAADITAELLRTHNMTVITYPHRPLRPTLIPTGRTPISRAMALGFAREHHTRYAVMGGVTEWNYKVGLDGEPAVGVNIEIIDTTSNQVVWNSVGSKSGCSRTALSTVAQRLIDTMLNTINYQVYGQRAMC